LGNKGFNVPAAAVLSTSFFESWLQQLMRSSAWETFSQAEGVEQVAAALGVKDLGLALAFTSEQQESLAAVRRYLDDEGIRLMAVRSSSPEEDTAAASFAGIYETVLGVNDRGLNDAIKTCFASALDERVVAYKQRSGFNPLEPNIAVIIQKQIASEVSGVAFSLNPVNNAYDHCVINANFGLGETVVDGRITPDQAIIDKVTHAILEKTPGKKDIALYLAPDGGIESTTPDDPDAFSLSEDQLLAVTRLTAQIEAEYGKPMDIEWTYAGGQLYLLQARPITAFYKLPKEMITRPGAQKNLYHDGLLTEQGLSENLSVLGSELYMSLGRLITPGLPEEAFMSIDTGMAFASGGRMYTQFGRLLKILGKKNALKTFGLTDALGAQVLKSMDLQPYVPKKLPKGFMKNFIKTVLGAMIFVRPLMSARRDPDRFLQYYIAENAGLKADLKGKYESEISFAALSVASYLRVGDHMNRTQLPALMASEMARGALKKLFKNAPEAVQDHLVFIEQSFPNNVTIEMGLLLYELSQFAEVQETGTAEAFVLKLDSGQGSADFMQKWQTFIEDYGFRGPKELDLATPRYYEKLDEVFAILKSMEDQDDPELTPRGLFERGARRRVESVRFLETYLAEQSKRKVKVFRKNYKLLENFAAYRESPKYFVIMVNDFLRRRTLDLGRQWVAAGRLDSADQVFDLRLDEFERAERESNLDIRKLAERNRDYFAQFNPENDPPNLIDSRGYIPKLPPKPRSANELEGTPVSSGRVVGKVKVLKRADEKTILPGDILVTKATDPGWTTLFINAAAVLLESGGTLQHGASVAREMGKPCVVGIQDLTKILEDGQLVQVDGATGRIEILE
jgi:pyruvate,water dikinase